jgi:hypothetical protein
MFKVITRDGETFSGDSAAEVVRQMRNCSWGVPQPKREYMLDVVERVEDMTGVFRNPDASYDDEEGPISAHEFIEYLYRAGVVDLEGVLPPVG